MQILKSLSCFVLAAICELSGAWLVWQWWRNSKPAWFAGIAGLVLIAYGIVNTFQAANFGRSYAAYGGVFIVMALMWGWQFENNVPDKFDLAGACICLGGMAVIMFSPR